MSKRFTDTEKWRKIWFIKLPLSGKVLWEYLRDCCDNAGFIEIDAEIISRDIGINLTHSEIMDLMKKQLIKITDKKYWIPKFIRHQYPKGLSEKCNAHKSVIDKLNKYDIEWQFINLKFTFKINNKATLREGLGNPCQRVQDKDKNKDKDKDKDKIYSSFIKKPVFLLISLMQRNDPKVKIPKDLKNWFKQANLLLNKDGRLEEEVNKVIRFSQADPFWKSNILSMGKLREKYTQLKLKMEGNNGKSGGTNQFTKEKDYDEGAPTGYFG